MNQVEFNEKDLPLKEMESMGLAAGGQLLLNVNDLQALLSGRRTAIRTMKDLEAEGVKIKSMEGKLSLEQDENGKIKLKIHPVYTKPRKPKFLDHDEAARLVKAEVPNILKKIGDKELLVEYDPETREFIVSDTEKIQAPDMVNNEYLSEAQQKKYRKGQEVELDDRTVFSYSAVDTNGIRSNRNLLIASLLIDGGLTYVLYQGLNHLFGKKHDEDAGMQSPGYKNALKDFENQKTEVNSQYSRSYTRSQGAR